MGQDRSATIRPRPKGAARGPPCRQDCRNSLGHNGRGALWGFRLGCRGPDRLRQSWAMPPKAVKKRALLTHGRGLLTLQRRTPLSPLVGMGRPRHRRPAPRTVLRVLPGSRWGWRAELRRDDSQNYGGTTPGSPGHRPGPWRFGTSLTPGRNTVRPPNPQTRRRAGKARGPWCRLTLYHRASGCCQIHVRPDSPQARPDARH